MAHYREQRGLQLSERDSQVVFIFGAFTVKVCWMCTALEWLLHNNCQSTFCVFRLVMTKVRELFYSLELETWPLCSLNR